MRQIALDLKSKVPIYIQIRDQLRLMIATGELKSETQMPPVRDLASDLLINPNTVAKAYQDLEREGYIYTKRGMGTFISERPDSEVAQRDINHASDVVREMVTRLLDMGMDADHIRRLVDETLEM
ncbi:MAG: GntR family transcriptional regulator [bacterium]|nr:GntR family transcriptional regulator [bacterium]